MYNQLDPSWLNKKNIRNLRLFGGGAKKYSENPIHHIQLRGQHKLDPEKLIDGPEM